jgi:hypothetical protein
LIALTAGCQLPTGEKSGGDEQAAAESAEEESTESHYSPFGVKLANGEHFHIISFKDVGLRRQDPKPNDPLLETIAQSLAYELQVAEGMQLSPRVVHDEALADPKEHVKCEANHLYVDVWRGEAPDRWGYSLWSGCSMEGQFAWREVPSTTDPDEDMTKAVEPLTEGIVESLADARQKGCFQKTC